jgi:hypothetical protein
MAKEGEVMTTWVVEALQQLGGRRTIIEIARRVWDCHEPDIRAACDLLTSGNMNYDRLATS